MICEVWLSGVVIQCKIMHFKPRMLDCLDKDHKITLHSNWKLDSSESPLDAARRFLFQFNKIWKIWLLGVVI